MITLLEAGLPGPGHLAALPGPGVEDAAGAGGVAVGEHRAPVHRPQHLEVLVGVGHLVALPQNTALEVTILLHQVLAAAGVLTETLAVVRLGPGGDGGAGGEVGGVQEAADGGAGVEGVEAPVAAGLLVAAQLLAGGGPLVAGQGQGEDHLGGVGLAAGHRDQGALGPGQGHQGQEIQEMEHRHWSPGG